MPCGFTNCASDFSYLCSKKKTNTTYVWRHKDVKAQHFDPGAKWWW